MDLQQLIQMQELTFRLRTVEMDIDNAHVTSELPYSLHLESLKESSLPKGSSQAFMTHYQDYVHQLESAEERGWKNLSQTDWQEITNKMLLAYHSGHAQTLGLIWRVLDYWYQQLEPKLSQEIHELYAALKTIILSVKNPLEMSAKKLDKAGELLYDIQQISPTESYPEQLFDSYLGQLYIVLDQIDAYQNPEDSE